MKTQRNRIITAPLKWAKALVVAVFFLALAVMATQQAHAQDDYNPYVIQGIVDQTGSSSGQTLLPAEFGGTGFVRFDVGQAGSSDLPFPSPNTSGDVVTLVITLSKGVPNVSDPNDPVDALNALSGAGVAWFDWIYDPGIRTYTATQKITIPGSTPGNPSRENITIAYKVTENSFLSSAPTVTNGFNVNLQPPGYTNPQPTDDDTVESYTYVEAHDYGDLPADGSTAPDGTNTTSYGEADHAINLVKSPATTGSYTDYMYLGTSVDIETAYQGSTGADGDDLNQTANNVTPGDDEDGVTWPLLILGETATIPVVVTIEDEGDPFGYLNAWIDWNGDGDFADIDEKIVHRLGLEFSGTENIEVTVPSDAITTAPTYARFRFGSRTVGSSGSSPFGEVEDYQITILDPSVDVSLVYAFAERGDDGLVSFTWKTATETGNAGFNILVQSEDGQWQQVNPELIFSHVVNSTAPQEYSYQISGVNGNTYRIQDVDYKTQTRNYGPFEIGEVHGADITPELIDWPAIKAEHEAKQANRHVLSVERVNQALDAAIIEDEAQESATQQDSAVERVSGKPIKIKKDDIKIDLLVNEDGIYRLSYEDLLASGFDIGAVKSKKLAVMNRGIPVLIYVAGPKEFGPGSYLEFYGEALDTLYSDTNVYTLLVNDISGAPMSVDTTAVNQAASTPAFYMETELVEENNAYNFLAPQGDPWYNQTLMVRTSPITWPFELFVDNYVPGAAPVTLSVGWWGASAWPWLAGPNHHVISTFNGNMVAEQYFQGVEDASFSMDVPVLYDGANLLELTAMGDTGAWWSMVNLDTYAVTYPRGFVARDGSLTFSGAGDHFRVENLNSPEVVVYRIVDGVPSRIEQVAIFDNGGTFAAMFPGAPEAATYVVAGADALKRPISVQAAPAQTDITSGNADYLIITHPDFIGPELDSLVQERQGRYEVKVVSVDDIYAQFSYGIFDAQAIRDYIAHAVNNMGVRYVLLVGGDTYDYRGYLPDGGMSFVPSLYLSTGAVSQWVPSDPLYADTDNDGVPDDVALGRFPVRSTSELQFLINKTFAYQDKELNGYGATAVLTADKGFAQDSQDILAQLPSNWSTQSASLDELELDEAKNILTGAINNGVALTSYVGHSGPSSWSYPRLFTGADAAALSNVSAPTVVTQWGCWNTYYVEPKYDTMAHNFLVEGDQGAAAVLGSTGVSYASSEKMLGSLLTPRLVEPGMTIGDAMKDAKAELAIYRPDMVDVLLGWTLLGDPSLVIQP